jgi:hypothetical protein
VSNPVTSQSLFNLIQTQSPAAPAYKQTARTLAQSLLSGSTVYLSVSTLNFMVELKAR